MTLDTVEALHQLLPDLGEKTIRLTWHGGEPLLAGIDFYRSVVSIQNRLLDNFQDLRVDNIIQTNGTLITDEWAVFFRENKWSVGVSLDGPAYIHNKYRVDNRGRGTLERVLKGTKKLQNAGVSVGVVAVVTSETARHRPDEVYKFLRSVSRNFELSPCWEAACEAVRPEYVVDPKAFLEFLKSIFDIWWKKDARRVRIRLLRNLVQGALSGSPIRCAGTGGCFQFIAIDAGGEVYPCDKFCGISEFVLGNILKQSLVEILNSQPYLSCLEIASYVPDKCKGCKWLNICRNGCTYDRYVGSRQFVDVSPFCETWRGALEYVNARVSVSP